MTRLYEKSKLAFALVWIGAYVVLLSLTDTVSATLGTEKLLTAPLSIVLTAVLYLWLRKNGLLAEYGLCPFVGSLKSFLYFIPLLIIGSCNLWHGVGLNYAPPEAILFAVSMLCVGFIEEVIFRGFLFKALAKDGLKAAVLISSVTFGFGHIVNLLSGAALLPTLLQILYATAVGFLFTMLFYRGKSLWPCILTHSVVNTLSVIGGETSAAGEITSALLLTAVSLGYGLYICKMPREPADAGQASG